MCDICLTHFLEEDTDIKTCAYVDYMYLLVPPPFAIYKKLRVYYCDECIASDRIYSRDLAMAMNEKLKEVRKNV